MSCVFEPTGPKLGESFAVTPASVAVRNVVFSSLVGAMFRGQVTLVFGGPASFVTVNV